MFTQNEWQYMDDDLGVLFPWYTKSFLDELKTLDLKDKKVLEIGIGNSTLWWVRKCKELYGIDNNQEWFDFISDRIKGNDKTSKSVITWCNSKDNYIDTIGSHRTYDIIIVDGTWRDECIMESINHLRTDGVLIVDNYNQEEVYLPSDEVKQALSSYDCKIYKQDGHDYWQTATFTRRMDFTSSPL